MHMAKNAEACNSLATMCLALDEVNYSSSWSIRHDYDVVCSESNTW